MINPKLKSSKCIRYSTPIETTVYMTTDYKEFEDINQANDHQNNLDSYEKWWKENTYVTKFPDSDNDIQTVLYIEPGGLEKAKALLNSKFSIHNGHRLVEGFNVVVFVDNEICILSYSSNNYLSDLQEEINNLNDFIRGKIKNSL